MGLTEWLIIGAAGLMIRSAAKKTAEERERQEADLEEYREKLRLSEMERTRLKSIEEKRKLTPCRFCDGLSADDFATIAHAAKKQIRRVKSISIDGAIVHGTVESQTGLSDWSFRIDFNNWGHVTGTYWRWTENLDSSIPKHFGDIMSSAIHDFLNERGISLEDFSDAVDDNPDLETGSGLSFSGKKNKRFFSKSSTISAEHSSLDLIGEHVYPVVSFLKNNGFTKIKCYTTKDVTEDDKHFIYEVNSISIDGQAMFRHGQTFNQDAEVEIVYHDKKEIIFPFSDGDFKRKNYVDVGDRIQELGFTEIYERAIRDLTTGWFTKDGSVEQILIEGDEECPIKKNVSYPYDTKIVICYHTFEK